ncbi:RNA 2',3'-cyclic phosphodiesterase [Sphingomonas sp. FW199]|uniref:RNA 2',3'-cyclic phosphodiesterase n=1 Tax=Sphingomonas sp. FW199 TaxID=3400217 RepID=UPI003CF2CC8A
MHRLFVAIRPPRAMREQLMLLMHGIHAARWQSDDQLHLTLRYIGEVPGDVAEDVALALGRVTGSPVTMALDGVGRFERRGRTDAVWAGVTPHAPLAALHRKIDQALIRIGLSPEGRAYLPHITLARLNAGSGPVDGFLAANAGLSGAAEAIGDFRLFESHLGGEGAVYETVARYPLSG